MSVCVSVCVCVCVSVCVSVCVCVARTHFTTDTTPHIRYFQVTNLNVLFSLYLYYHQSLHVQHVNFTQILIQCNQTSGQTKHQEITEEFSVDKLMF